MKIMGADPQAMRGRGRQMYLRPELKLEDMLTRLAISSPPGMSPEDHGPSLDGKCKHQVVFYANGSLCGFWDYRGERWSAFGPYQVFDDLGWTDYTR